MGLHRSNNQSRSTPAPQEMALSTERHGVGGGSYTPTELLHLFIPEGLRVRPKIRVGDEKDNKQGQQPESAPLRGRSNKTLGGWVRGGERGGGGWARCLWFIYCVGNPAITPSVKSGSDLSPVIMFTKSSIAFLNSALLSCSILTAVCSAEASPWYPT